MTLWYVEVPLRRANSSQERIVKVATSETQRSRFGSKSIERALVFLMGLPNLAWILLDQGRWVSDSSFYGLGATNLNHTLLQDTSNWWTEMLAISPKPPILPWVGQFLVSLGRLIGSIDIGLLLIIFLAHFGGLLFLHGALMKVFHRQSLALLGCLIVASTPIFILFSSQFYIQPVQLFAVSWFLWIMVSSRTWDSVMTLLHLASASAIAVLATMSSPAYCIVPGLIALWNAWKNRTVRIRFRGAHLGIAALAAVTVVLSVAWYLRNFEEAAAYGRFGYSFAYAGEVRDVFLIKLSEWGRLLLFGFVVSTGVLLLFAWALATHLRRETRRWSGEVAVMLCLGVQILLILITLASSAHQTFRYLLPLGPYFAMVGIWSLSAINRNWLRRAMLVALLLQLVATNALMHLWGGGHLAKQRRRYLAAVDAVGQATAGETPDSIWSAIGELGVYNFDLAYHASKSADYDPDNNPSYHAIELTLTESEADRDVEALWKRIEAARRVYVVLLREPPPPLDVDRSGELWRKVREDSRVISSRVRRSAQFEKLETPASWEVEIYRDVR
jgi:hypothetical protein